MANVAFPTWVWMTIAALTAGVVLLCLKLVATEIEWRRRLQRLRRDVRRIKANHDARLAELQCKREGRPSIPLEAQHTGDVEVLESVAEAA